MGDVKSLSLFRLGSADFLGDGGRGEGEEKGDRVSWTCWQILSVISKPLGRVGVLLIHDSSIFIFSYPKSSNLEVNSSIRSLVRP